MTKEEIFQQLEKLARDVGYGPVWTAEHGKNVPTIRFMSADFNRVSKALALVLELSKTQAQEIEALKTRVAALEKPFVPTLPKLRK